MDTRWLQLIAAFSMLTALAAGCQGPDFNGKILKDPNPEALAAGRAFQKQNPHARVFFSQTTGEVMWIDGGGRPLYRGSAGSSAEAIATVSQFMDRYPALYRIDHPAQALLPAFDGFGLKRSPRNAGG